MLDYNHHTKISGIELLSFANDGKKLNLLEAYEIKKNSLASPLIKLLDSPLFDTPLNRS